MTGPTGTTGTSGTTGTTGPVGPTGSQNMYVVGAGPQTIGLSANTPTFMTNTATVVSLTTTSRYMIVISMQSRNTIGTAIYLISSIGRTINNTVPTVGNATNLSNGTLFGNTEIAIASTDTYLMAASSSSSGTGLGNSYMFIDNPGIGTITYSIRVLSNAALNIRQYYINVIQVNA
jgi:hypothetical protein